MDENPVNRVSISDSVQMNVKKRRTKDGPSTVTLQYQIDSEDEVRKKQLEIEVQKYKSWKRMLLLIIAITVHNIPGKFDVYTKKSRI